MIKIKEYSKLRKAIREFKKGTFDFLIIISSAGFGKTYNTRKILKKVCMINSHITTLELYIQAYENKDLPLWFDDVEALFEKDKTIGLLKQLCETTEKKIIQYNTSWGEKQLKGIPKTFNTKSKVIMTTNSIARIKNKGVKSLLDRAIIINFSPSKQEIITYIKNNFKSIYNKRILDKLQIKDNFSLRDYIKQVQLNKSGLKL
jgi:hypothetical protein